MTSSTTACQGTPGAQLALVQPRADAAVAQLLGEPADGGLVVPVVAEEDVEFRDFFLAPQHGGSGGELPAGVRRGVHRGDRLVGAADHLVVVLQGDPSLADRAQDVHPAEQDDPLDLLGGERGAVVRAGVLAFAGDAAGRGPAVEVGVHEALELLLQVVRYPVVPDPQLAPAVALVLQEDGALPGVGSSRTGRPTARWSPA